MRSLGISGAILFLLFSSSSALAVTTGFIENAGQIDDRVLFYAGGPQASVFFTRDAVVIALLEEVKPGSSTGCVETRAAGQSAERHARQKGCAVWIRFDGANPAVSVDAADLLTTRYNYFLGNDPAAWRTGVRAYRTVTYHDLWPGSDVVFHEEDGALAYDVVGPPGAAGGVRYIYDGGEAEAPTDDNVFRISTDAGAFLDLHPGAGEVYGAFVLERGDLLDRNGARGPRARDNPGAMLWGTFLGGSGDDPADGLICDASGNPILAGWTVSQNFPTTPGAYDRTNDGSGDSYVAKVSASGGELLWSTFIGGSGDDECIGRIYLDPDGNPIISGYTRSANFPTTADAYDQSLNGQGDIYVAKLAALGDALLWSTYLGSSGDDWGRCIDPDPDGNTVITGITNGPDFPTTPGAYDESHNGGWDAVVAKLSGTGDALLWSTFLGGTLPDRSWTLVVDRTGCPIVIGRTESSDFPTTPGALDESYNGGTGDAFVAKFSPSGDALLWSTFLGGSHNEVGYILALDSSQNLVLTGQTDSPDFPTTPGAADESYNGGLDVVVAKLSSSGTDLLWSTFLGGTGNEYGCFDLILDPSGKPIVIGATDSSNFPTTGDPYDASFNGGGYDAFIARFSGDGGTLLTSTFLGGSGGDAGYGLALDSSWNLLATGATLSSNFATTPGAYDNTHNGAYDAFLAKFDLGASASADDPRSPAPRSDLGLTGPNPVRLGARSPLLEIRYDVPVTTRVRLDLLDSTGRQVARLVDEMEEAGRKNVAWRPAGLGSGVYFYRLQAAGLVATRKIVVLDSGSGR